MIGSGQGVQDWDGVRRIVERVSVPVVVDAGIGAASDAVRAMEAGANTAAVQGDFAHPTHHFFIGSHCLVSLPQKSTQSS